MLFRSGYEKAGLVHSYEKNKYGHLLYDRKTVERIEKVRLYQQLGFEVKEIRKIIDAPAIILKSALEEKVQLLKQNMELENQLLLKTQKMIEALSDAE